MGDFYNVNETGAGSTPITPRQRAASVAPAPISAPPSSQLHSPSLSRSPGPTPADHIQPAAKTPITNSTPRPRFITTPSGSPSRRALQLTGPDPHDAWLPITESRNGNAYYAAFHVLCSGIGIQALLLPVAFAILGWSWGIISLSLAFVWQLYTLYLLVQLHEYRETGMRYSRYLQLCDATFGEKLAKWLALMPTGYLSGGTCVGLIAIGSSNLKLFFDAVCGGTCWAHPPTTVEWYLIFTTAAVVLSQLPNLNSIAGVSLVGAVTAIGYCTLIWVVPVVKGRLPGVSYDPVTAYSDVARIFDVLNALGIIAFAFPGHNLILEIQATMPSDEKHPSRVPMWKGVKVAYTLVAMCLFPIAIGGYWAYGQLIPKEIGRGGMLAAMYAFHSRDTTSQLILGLISLLVTINSLTSFQIYGMPTFDDIESGLVRRMKKPLPWWTRAALRVIVGYACFFAAVALPFVSRLTNVLGGIALPVTFAYPCFMWLKVRKPEVFSPKWWLNWSLGLLGMALSGVLIAAALYVVINTGVEISFFNPQ